MAAVFYLLGEEFHRDPFLIFKLRGLDRAELMGFLGGSRAGRLVGQAAGHDKTGVPAPEPLTAAPGAFWEEAELPEDLLVLLCHKMISLALSPMTTGASRQTV